MSRETVTHATLRELCEAGAIREAVAVAVGDRWAVVVRHGGIERTLAGRNSRKVRSWTNLNSVVRYLADLGIYEFVTDARNYDPSQKTLKRPDKASALRRAHEAAEHDKWFREQVQQALDDPRPPISHEEMKRRMEHWLMKQYGPRPHG